MPTSPDLSTIANEIRTDLLHPEFGSIYMPPDGEAYVAYQQGLAEGEARSFNKEKKTMAQPKKSPIVDESVEIVPLEDGSGFTVVDTGLPAPTFTYDSTPLSKNDLIALGILSAVVAGVVGAIGWFGYKDEKKRTAESKARMAEMKRRREERAQWFEDQRKAGKTVIETRDGVYMAIPNEAFAAAEIRTKAL